MKKLLIPVALILLISACEKMVMGPEPANTPEENFDVLWQTIDEKYGLFPIKNINWDSLYDIHRDQLKSPMSDYELWAVCCSLLAPLQNGHVCLINQQFTKWYSPDSPPVDVYIPSDLKLIKSQYLDTPSVTGEGVITYAKINQSTLGYIHIQHFMDVNGHDWIRDMDEAIRALASCDGLIIDVRNNGGGLVRNDMYAASYFTDKPLTYYYSQHKTGPAHNDFGEIIPKILYPRKDGLMFLKKTAVLTNRHTASGAEAFTLMLKKTGMSVQIGDTTIGALGEVTHVAQLPNGWILKYPCTLTTLEDGSSPECIGIPPDIYIINTEIELNEGIDSILEKGIEYLEGI